MAIEEKKGSRAKKEADKKIPNQSSAGQAADGDMRKKSSSAVRGATTSGGSKSAQRDTRKRSAQATPVDTAQAQPPSKSKPGGGKENDNSSSGQPQPQMARARPESRSGNDKQNTPSGEHAAGTRAKEHVTEKGDRPTNSRSNGGRRSGGGRQGTGKAQRGSQPRTRGGSAPARRRDEEVNERTQALAKKAVQMPERPKELVLPAIITIRDLSSKMKVSPIDVIKELMNNGVMANINQQIDYDTAAIVASELGFIVTEEKPPEEEKEETVEVKKTLRQIISETEDPTQLKPRPPVVTVLGHVDHGKTTLLDAIRHTAVVESEAGGITQRIGAYQVDLDGRRITFLDTPGHEAFTAMRARGAQVTDLAVLVVAADDGVMPQTREAIDHARAAKVPILVALNKIDKTHANPDLLKQQLANIGLVVEEWGGDVICVPVSAKMRKGIDDLLENILLVTEVAELKANPNCPAVGTVVEGRLDKARGVVATLLVQNGSLHVGDILVVGEVFGRVRAMFDDTGKPVDAAPPSMPVAVLGLPAVPSAGNVFRVLQSEKEARMVVGERIEQRRESMAQPTARSISLEDIASQIKAGQIKELNIVLKADVQGSIEPIVNSLTNLGSEDLRAKVLHAGTGIITESDIMLAAASQAIVIGFAVDADNVAQRLAEQERVSIRRYDVIYELIEDVESALKGMIDPEYRDVVHAHAEVRAVFRIPKVGNIAGSYVKDGTVHRDARARVIRDGEPIYEGPIQSLRRLKDDVREVQAGYEFGVGLGGFDEIQEGDIIEFYKKELVK